MPETPEASFTKTRVPTRCLCAHGQHQEGERLVMNDSDGKDRSVHLCHGPDLLGLAASGNRRTPPWLHRAPAFDMQNGARTGTWTDMMKPVVEK